VPIHEFLIWVKVSIFISFSINSNSIETRAGPLRIRNKHFERGNVINNNRFTSRIANCTGKIQLD
jgi:hypothetical protein